MIPFYSFIPVIVVCALIILGVIAVIVISSRHMKVTPRDFSLTVFNYLLIYTVVIALMVLLSQYVNFTFPDALNDYYDPYYGGFDYQMQSIFNLVRSSSALLIVLFPLFIWTSKILSRDYAKDIEKRNSVVRKWFGYLTLFASGITAIIALVMLIYNFYGGELSIRFGLKILIVGVLSAVVFFYYRWDIKHCEATVSAPKILVWVSGLVILASIVVGFFIVGSPSYQRSLRLDSRRIEHLSSLQYEVLEFWQKNELLPKDQKELVEEFNGYVLPVDPVTQESYIYEYVDELRYNLCATFDEASFDGRGDNTSFTPVGLIVNKEAWRHESGYVCFERKIDPERDKINELYESHPLPIY